MNQIQHQLIELLRQSADRTYQPSCDWTSSHWEAIIHEAKRHKLAPLLYHRLSLISSLDLIPTSVRACLKKYHRDNAAFNLGRFSKLGPVLLEISRTNIPVIVLKGAYLAAEVYDNFALREMDDIDLLVPRENLLHVDSILTAAKFTRVESSPNPAPNEKELHYFHRQSKTSIDVHWELYKPENHFFFDLAEMRANAVSAVVAGTEVLAFAPEDQLIHLASHMVVHRFSFGLRSLFDLTELLAAKKINWTLLESKAKQSKTSRPVALSLLLARDLLKTDIPDATIAALMQGVLPERLYLEARGTILLNLRVQRNQGEPNPNLLLFMGRRKTRQKVTLLKNRFFPARETIAARYPFNPDSPMIWFCYPIYGLRILKRNLSGMRTLFRRKIKRNAKKSNAADLMEWMLRQPD